MNEKDPLERLFGAAPTPPPDVTARARTKLTNTIDGSNARTRIRRRPVFGLVGLAAVATAAAIVVPTLATNGSGLPRSPDSTATELVPAKQVLLGAANNAERAEEQPAGRYWRARTYAMPVLDYQKVGEEGDKYNITDPVLEETWIGLTAEDGNWTGSRSVGHRPARAADWAAWKRDGKPRKWNLGGDHIVTWAPSKPTLYRDSRGDLFVEYVSDFSYEELRRLPDQPEQLKQALLELRDRAEYQAGPNRWVFEFSIDLLASAPVSPDVRAAAFRVLADLPNVHNLGPATDPLGREGIALAIRESDDSVTPPTELIIDQDAGRVLAEKIESVKSFYTTYLPAEWTNEKPSMPSKSDIPDIPYAE